MVRFVACATVFISLAAWGQSPSFDAASLKPAGPRAPGPGGGLTGGPGTADPGRISGSRVPLGVLLGVGFPILPIGSKSRLSIGMRMAGGGDTPTATLTSASYRETMAEFAAGLSFLIRSASGGTSGSPAPRVTDKTGLTGIYEFHLRYATPNMSATPGPAEADDPALGGETLFNALSSQLGLKLQKAKSVPVDVIVIDHADLVPVEN